MVDKKEKSKKNKKLHYLLSGILIIGMIMSALDSGFSHDDFREISLIGLGICFVLPLIKIIVWKLQRMKEESKPINERKPQANAPRLNSSNEFSSKEGGAIDGKELHLEEVNAGSVDENVELKDLYSSVHAFNKNKNRISKESVAIKDELKGFPALSCFGAGIIIYLSVMYNNIIMNMLPILIIVGLIGFVIGMIFYKSNYTRVAATFIAFSIAVYLGGGIIGFNKEFDQTPASVTTPIIISVERRVVTGDRGRADSVRYFATIWKERVWDEEDLLGEGFWDVENWQPERVRVSATVYYANSDNEPLDGRRIMAGEFDRVIYVERNGALGFRYSYVVPEEWVHRYIDYLEDLNDEQ